MKIVRWFSVFLCLSSAIVAYAQMDQYNYSHELSGVQEQWHSISIPVEAYGVLNKNFSDLRIYGLTTGSDTLEIPYLIRTGSAKLINKELKGTLINKSHKQEGYYYTYKLPELTPINHLSLNLATDNFDWTLKLEGSNDQREWFTIKESSRIVAIKNELTDYSFTKLPFDPCEYLYYRILIPSSEDPQLVAVVSSLIDRTEARQITFKTGSTEQKIVRSNVDQLDITLELASPVSAIDLEVRDTVDYYRPIEIQYLIDSVMVGSKYRYNYRMLYRGTLSSVERPSFDFDEVITSRLRVLISNYDNNPLSTGDIPVKGYAHELIARFSEEATHYLCYGREKVYPPRYDLTAFKNKIPSSPISLQVGAQQQSQHLNSKKMPLITNSLWLWLVMFLIIILIGYFSLTMMKKVES